MFFKTIHLISLTLASVLFAEGQELQTNFIDSVAERHNSCKTILLFSQIHDTMDNQTGKKYTQQISIYYDRVHKQLRDIDVYNFNEMIDAHTIQKAFRRQKKIPLSTHIVYTFFNCSIVKVKIHLSENSCKECLGEYYFQNDTLINKKEINISVEKKDKFIGDATAYLGKLELLDKNLVQCAH